MKPCLQEDVLQTYLDGELPRQTSDSVVAHLAQCPSCALRVRQAQHTLMAIDGAVESQLPEVIATARLRTRLEAALALRAAPKFSLAWLWQWKLAAVAAAGLLLMLSAMVIYWQSTGKPQPEEQTALPTPVTPPGSQPPSPAPREPQVVAQQPQMQQHQQRRRRAFRNRSDEAEVVTQFFPLREGEDLTALASLRLVRVELPVSALSEVGLQLTPEAANTSVKADVLLGDDGLARAIRFVR